MNPTFTSQVLRLTRSQHSSVREAAVLCALELFSSIGEELIILLPETLPFLSELLEDGDPAVESRTRELVRKLEELSGESVQSYLTS